MATIQYNHDIDVGAKFLRQYPRISQLLRNQQFVDYFYGFDRAARKAKKQMYWLGFASLLAATVALLAICAELAAYALGDPPPKVVTVIVECIALASLVVVGVIKWGNIRQRYVTNCHARERLRLWHFQSFLDGELMSGLAVGDCACKDEYRRKLHALVDSLKSNPGSSVGFMRGDQDDLAFEVKAYSSSDVQSDCMDALSALRFSHQASYVSGRTGEDPPDRILSLEEHVAWSEAIARFSLLAAVVLATAQLLMAMGLVSGHGFGHESGLKVVMFAMTLGLVVVSVAAHSYGRGTTSSEELESYEHYYRDVVAYRYDATAAVRRGDAIGWQTALKSLELSAVAELRRFLRMKSGSTFLL